MFDNKTDFKKEFSNRLIQSYGTTVEDTHPTDRLLVRGQMIRDYASLNWKETKVAERKQEAKQVELVTPKLTAKRTTKRATKKN